MLGNGCKSDRGRPLDIPVTSMFNSLLECPPLLHLITCLEFSNVFENPASDAASAYLSVKSVKPTKCRRSDSAKLRRTKCCNSQPSALFSPSRMAKISSRTRRGYRKNTASDRLGLVGRNDPIQIHTLQDFKAHS